MYLPHVDHLINQHLLRHSFIDSVTSLFNPSFTIHSFTRETLFKFNFYFMLEYS